MPLVLGRGMAGSNNLRTARPAREETERWHNGCGLKPTSNPHPAISMSPIPTDSTTSHDSEARLTGSALLESSFEVPLSFGGPPVEDPVVIRVVPHEEANGPFAQMVVRQIEQPVGFCGSGGRETSVSARAEMSVGKRVERARER